MPKRPAPNADSGYITPDADAVKHLIDLHTWFAPYSAPAWGQPTPDPSGGTTAAQLAAEWLLPQISEGVEAKVADMGLAWRPARDAYRPASRLLRRLDFIRVRATCALPVYMGRRNEFPERNDPVGGLAGMRGSAPWDDIVYLLGDAAPARDDVPATCTVADIARYLSPDEPCERIAEAVLESAEATWRALRDITGTLRPADLDARIHDLTSRQVVARYDRDVGDTGGGRLQADRVAFATFLPEGCCPTPDPGFDRHKLAQSPSSASSACRACAAVLTPVVSRPPPPPLEADRPLTVLEQLVEHLGYHNYHAELSGADADA